MIKIAQRFITHICVGYSILSLVSIFTRGEGILYDELGRPLNEDPITDNIISFKVPPTKRKDSMVNNVLDFKVKKDMFCFQLETDIGESSSEDLFVIITAEDYLSFKYNSDRFGGTNSDFGKQSLDVVVKNADTDDIIRSTKNLPVGETIIQFRRPEICSNFIICFANLATDFSWKKINTEKYITVEITTEEMYEMKSKLHFQRNFKQDTEEVLQNLVNDLGKIIRSDGIGQNNLIFAESERRNLNEMTFTGLIMGLSMLTTALMASHILPVYYLSRHLKTLAIKYC